MGLHTTSRLKLVGYMGPPGAPALLLKFQPCWDLLSVSLLSPSPFVIMFNPTDTCLGFGGLLIKRDEKTPPPHLYPNLPRSPRPPFLWGRLHLAPNSGKYPNHILNLPSLKLPLVVLLRYSTMFVFAVQFHLKSIRFFAFLPGSKTSQ